MDATSHATETAARWRATLPWLALALAGVVLAMRHSFVELATIWWTSSTFSHCLLVVPISLWLCWLNRERLAQVAPRPAPLALVYGAANALLWLAGALLGIAFFQHLAAIGLVVATVWALLGTPVLAVILFPVLYLYFGVPEGEFLVPYLQDWTAMVVVALLRLTDIPVYLEGRYLAIPSGNFVVEEACSGINYLIATIAVGSVFAYLRFASFGRRVLFMLLAVAVPLLANGLRAYGIVMIAHLSDYKYAVGIDHIIYGWGFFGVVIFALFALGSLFSDRDHAGDAPLPPAARAAGQPRTGRSLVPWVVACVAVAAGPAALVDFARAAPQAVGAVAWPEVPGWRQTALEEQAIGGAFVGASTYLGAAYQRDSASPVYLEAWYYAQQNQDAELVNQVNRVFDRAAWNRIADARRALDSSSVIADVHEWRLRGAGGERLAWQWYDVHGVTTSAPLWAKLSEVRGLLTRSRLGSAALIVSTPVDGDIERARTRLAAFIEAAQPGVKQLVRK